MDLRLDGIKILILFFIYWNQINKKIRRLPFLCWKKHARIIGDNILYQTSLKDILWRNSRLPIIYSKIKCLIILFGIHMVCCLMLHTIDKCFKSYLKLLEKHQSHWFSVSAVFLYVNWDSTKLLYKKLNKIWIR